MIKGAAQILAEIEEDDDDPEIIEITRPLKQPNRHGTLVRTNRYPRQRKSNARPARLCELVPGCVGLHVAKGGCGQHYYRLRTYGHPLGGVIECPSGRGGTCGRVYWCPTVGEFESPCHGGFDVCCDQPELHEVRNG